MPMAVRMPMVRGIMLGVVGMTLPCPAVCMWGCAHREPGYANSAVVGQVPLD